MAIPSMRPGVKPYTYDPTDELIEAFQMIEDRPVKLAKRAMALQEAQTAGVDVGSIPGVSGGEPGQRRYEGAARGGMEVDDPRAVHLPAGTDRLPYANYQPAISEEALGGVRVPQPGRGQDYRTLIQDSMGPGSRSEGALEGQDYREEGFDPQSQSPATPRAFGESVRAGVTGGAQAVPGAERRGLPPGDVRAPMGTPEQGPEQPSPTGSGDVTMEHPRFRMRSGVEFGRPDLGQTLASAFQHERGRPGAYSAEVIRQRPDLASTVLRGTGSYYSGRSSSSEGGRFEVTPEMIRATGAPDQEKEAAIDAYRKGRQRALYNWYVGWRGPQGSTGGGDFKDTPAYANAVSEGIDMVDQGADVSEAARAMTEKYEVPIDPSDLGLAYERSQDPERWIARTYGQPQGRLAEAAWNALRRGGNPAEVRRYILENYPQASQQELDQLDEFLTPKVDPLDMYLQGRIGESLYGRRGGQ